jgi:RNA polymerase sigma factor (sigma-70 family)
MSFPQTRLTLIQRIVTQGDEKDWNEFLADYWGSVCRFAMRRGSLKFEDAEDVASLTFEALVHNQLLARWVSDRAAKLRTLLCGVVCNVLANRARVQSGRERLLGERGVLPLVTSLEIGAEQVDAFYAAWVEEVLHQAVEALLAEYHRGGRGDYFRVLYGRVCDEMTMPEIGQALNLKTSSVENYFKHARNRLAEELQELVRDHVHRYCPEAEMDAEFAAEWERLGQYLQENGGLEQTVRRSGQAALPLLAKKAQTTTMNIVLTRITGILSENVPDEAGPQAKSSGARGYGKA